MWKEIIFAFNTWNIDCPGRKQVYYVKLICSSLLRLLIYINNNILYLNVYKLLTLFKLCLKNKSFSSDCIIGDSALKRSTRISTILKKKKKGKNVIFQFNFLSFVFPKQINSSYICMKPCISLIYFKTWI